MAKSSIPLTHERLKSVLDYNPETGIFTWLIKPSAKVKIGDAAGYKQTPGYIMINVDGRSYLGHRLAWFYVSGSWPQNQIDHKDTNKSNNIWSNLREANRSQNAQNTPARSNNSSGFKGVHQDKRKKKWRAMIMVEGKLMDLGWHDTALEAHAAYCAAATKHFGEFARKS